MSIRSSELLVLYIIDLDFFRPGSLNRDATGDAENLPVALNDRCR